MSSGLLSEKTVHVGVGPCSAHRKGEESSPTRGLATVLVFAVQQFCWRATLQPLRMKIMKRAGMEMLAHQHNAMALPKASVDAKSLTEYVLLPLNRLQGLQAINLPFLLQAYRRQNRRYPQQLNHRQNHRASGQAAPEAALRQSQSPFRGAKQPRTSAGGLATCNWWATQPGRSTGWR